MTTAAPVDATPSPAPQLPTQRRQQGAGRFVASATAVLLVVAVAALLAAVATGRLAVARVTTGSMAPAVPTGSLIVGRPVREGGLAVGDLLTAHVDAAGGVVTHRVVGVRREAGRTLVRTKGDANEAPDPWMTSLPHDGATRVVASVPRLGHALGRGPGGVPLLALPLLLGVLTWSGCRWLLAQLGGVP